MKDLKHVKLFIILTLLTWTSIYSNNGDDRISTTYDHALSEILNLRTKTARKILDADGNSQEFNLYKEYLYNWSEVIELTLQEDNDKYDEYLDHLDLRLDRIEEKADKNDPSYHILLAEIYAHAAMANIVYNDFFSGFRKMLKCNKNEKLNEELHPGYWQNNKLGGTINVSFAMMPPMLKTMAGLFGLKGDAKKGYKQLDQYLKDVSDYPGLRSEALIYYGFTLKIAKDEDRAYKLLSKNIEKENATALALFLTSNVMFLTAHNEEALQYLDLFPENNLELPFHHIDYLKGKEKLNRLDLGAGTYLKRYLDKSQFKNYHRETCLKLSHHYFIHGDKAKYEYYQNKIDDYLKATTDRDREADIEQNRPYPPHKELLKARYLVSGGYFSIADSILGNIDTSSLKIPGYINESHLLQAKIKDSQNKSIAISLYDQVIKEGKNAEEHYAAEAAFMASKYYLRNDDLLNAKKYAKLTLDTDCGDDVYIEVIHKKAKNLLNRIINK
jgi:hypothetical protein